VVGVLGFLSLLFLCSELLLIIVPHQGPNVLR
jgi:hypothetical protein